MSNVWGTERWRKGWRERERFDGKTSREFWGKGVGLGVLRSIFVTSEHCSLTSNCQHLVQYVVVYFKMPVVTLSFSSAMLWFTSEFCCLLQNAIDYLQTRFLVSKHCNPNLKICLFQNVTACLSLRTFFRMILACIRTLVYFEMLLFVWKLLFVTFFKTLLPIYFSLSLSLSPSLPLCQVFSLSMYQ